MNLGLVVNIWGSIVSYRFKDLLDVLKVYGFTGLVLSDHSNKISKYIMTKPKKPPTTTGYQTKINSKVITNLLHYYRYGFIY